MRRVAGFWSYSRRDDPDALEALHKALQDEISHRVGSDFTLWRDRQDIATGTQWRDEIVSGASAAQILIAIITPRWIASPYCREEYQIFKDAEFTQSVCQRIFPVYYIPDGALASHSDSTDTIVSDIRARQCANWTRIREALRAKGTSDPEVREAICKLAEEIAGAARQIARTESPGENNRKLADSAPARHGTRVILPQGTPVRPDGPARIELSSGGNCPCTLESVDLRVATEFGIANIETRRFLFPLSVSRALIQVDASEADLEQNSCFAHPSNGAVPGIRYKRLGEWEIEHLDGRPLEGDFFPEVPACRLVNCGPRAGATARIVVSIRDLKVHMSEVKEVGKGIFRILSPTKEKLIAIWLRERACSALGGTKSQVILHDAKLKTEVS